MFHLIALLAAVALVLFSTRWLAWHFVKNRKPEVAKKMKDANGKIRETVSRTIHGMDQSLSHSIFSSRKPNLGNSIRILVVSVVAESAFVRYDPEKSIRNGMKAEIAGLLGKIEAAILGTDSAEVRSYLENVKRDVIR